MLTYFLQPIQGALRFTASVDGNCEEAGTAARLPEVITLKGSLTDFECSLNLPSIYLE